MRITQKRFTMNARALLRQLIENPVGEVQASAFFEKIPKQLQHTLRAENLHTSCSPATTASPPLAACLPLPSTCYPVSTASPNTPVPCSHQPCLPQFSSGSTPTISTTGTVTPKAPLSHLHHCPRAKLKFCTIHLLQVSTQAAEGCQKENPEESKGHLYTRV